jgi:hypothetical protein
VVESVERLSANLEGCRLVDLEILVQVRGEVNASGSNQGVFAPVAEAQVGTARPGRRDVVVDAGLVVPIVNLLGIGKFAAGCDIRTVGITFAQADWIVATRCAQTERHRYAGLLDKGSSKLPSACDGLEQTLALVEERQVVDVVDVEDVTAIQVARTLVILRIPGVVEADAVLVGNIDFVRPRVIDIAAQAPAVLDAETGLEAVVGAVGLVDSA